MATLRVGSVLLVVGCCMTACGGSEDPPRAGTDVTGGAGSANTSAGTTGGAAAPTGGDSTTGGVTEGTGGATAGSSVNGETATSSAATGSAATTGGMATAGAATGGPATGGASSDGATTDGTAAGGAATEGATTGEAASNGATTGSDPNCFPPLTDFAARDGGFGSAEREIVEIGSGDSVSLFRPSDERFGQAGCQYPLLVWGNGSTNTVDIWASHLSRAASFGFVVVAPEQTQVSAEHMNAALDYVLALSQDASSAYYDKIDTSKLGSTGYSLGGMGAMRVAADARIGATFIWDSFGDASALHGPLGGIFAEDGIGSGPDVIDDCPFPSFAMQAAGTTHTSILSFPGGFGGPGGSTPYAQEAYVGWFRWHFMGDAAAQALFSGDACGFCTREGITVHTN